MTCVKELFHPTTQLIISNLYASRDTLDQLLLKYGYTTMSNQPSISEEFYIVSVLNLS